MTGRIIIIDGIATNRILMKVRLTSACYEVGAFPSAQEAIHSLRQYLPDIIVIGMSLPDMANTDLCQIIRSLPGCRTVPVLMQVPDPQRLAALSAGATAIIEAPYDELTLLARIRGLLRDAAAPLPDEADTALPPGEMLSTELPPASPSGMAENISGFDHLPLSRLTLVSDHSASALGWRHALQSELGHRVEVCDPERALAEAQAGDVPDIYLIAADIHQPGDGLRLLSELRSRSHSRHAGFLVLLPPEGQDRTAVALDLGAGDVLPSILPDAGARAEAAIRIRSQLERKRIADIRRQETRRNLLWAMTDPLTGLYNRRFAMPHLAGMIDHGQKCRETVAVLLMDIDHFKAVNDLHGHAAGDLILSCVAGRLRDHLPDEGLLARIGGEEFLCAIRTDCAAAALDLAETMRLAISSAPFRFPKGISQVFLDITISMGVAVLPSASCIASLPTTDELIAAADHALFAAKSRGRNRVVSEHREMTASHPLPTVPIRCGALPR